MDTSDFAENYKNAYCEHQDLTSEPIQEIKYALFTDDNVGLDDVSRNPNDTRMVTENIASNVSIDIPPASISIIHDAIISPNMLNDVSKESNISPKMPPPLSSSIPVLVEICDKTESDNGSDKGCIRGINLPVSVLVDNVKDPEPYVWNARGANNGIYIYYIYYILKYGILRS